MALEALRVDLSGPGRGTKMNTGSSLSRTQIYHVSRLISRVNLAGPQAPDVGSNITLDVSVRVFWDETYTEVRGLGGKRAALSECGWATAHQLEPE